MKIISLVVISSVAAIGGVLFLTNPNKEDYARYASQTLTAEVQTSLCRANDIPPLFERIDSAIQGFCERTVGRVVSSEAIEDIVLENTDRKNRLFFSTYETTLPQQTYRTVGVFNRFYPYGYRRTSSDVENPGVEGSKAGAS